MDAGHHVQERSEVLVVRGSLLVLDVLLLVPLDASIGELGGVDLVAPVVHSAGASPVPVHPAHKLKASDLLIGQVCDDFKHLSTVAIETEDLEMEEPGAVDDVL